MLIFGGGTRYARKENGKKMLHFCTNCKKETTFFQIVPTDYISFFFIPVFSAEQKTTNENTFECSVCEQQIGIYSFEKINIFKMWLKNFFSKYNFSEYFAERKKRKKEKDIQNQLKKMKSKIKKDSGNL